MLQLSKKIDVYEVGPRDGFQNLSNFVPTEQKLEVIDRLVKSGVKYIQHTSFVSPKAVPQMKDSKEVTKVCLEKYPEVQFFALVPNLYGAKVAWDSGLRMISYVVSLSASHNKANINRTHQESFAELKKIVESFPKLDICLDLSTTFGCPFEGKFPTERVVEFLKDYVELGIKEVNLCDTIGIGNPKEVREIINAVQQEYPQLELQVHIHDTRNMGMVNTLAAIECGVTKIQSTLGGLGGCPFAPGASGNLATEDVVYMLNDMGYDTGINFEKLLEAAKYQKTIIPDGNYSGHHIDIKAKEVRNA